MEEVSLFDEAQGWKGGHDWRFRGLVSLLPDARVAERLSVGAIAGWEKRGMQMGLCGIRFEGYISTASKLGIGIGGWEEYGLGLCEDGGR